MDVDHIEPTPPTSHAVARQALILSAIACRGGMEGDNSDPSGASSMIELIQTWLRNLDLWSHLTRWEHRIVSAPFGTLSQRDAIDASWLSESMAILAWALGKTPLPDCDKQCDPASVATSLGFLKPVDMTVLTNPVLLEPGALDEFNEFIYQIHWRLRDFSLFGRPYDFESLARAAWGTPVERYGLKLIQGDIGIGGVPLYESDDHERGHFGSITRERHRASNWLIGYAAQGFYEVTTDT
ncbi:MAG: DUF4272 domain-containing protein [Luteolibacter sp.]